MLRCGLPDKKSGNPRKSRERKRSKRLKRQQPERKEKYRECQCRANRKKHHKLSKPSARHDMQRQRSGALALSFPKIQSGRIRAVRQNQRIMRCDVCDHPPACNVYSRSVQVTTPAGSREPFSASSAQLLPETSPTTCPTSCRSPCPHGLHTRKVSS